MGANRQPLNYSAPDLSAASEFTPSPLRDEIDYWRSEALRRRHRLDDAHRLAGIRFHGPGTAVDTPESAGRKYRRAMSVLHYLLALEKRLVETNPSEPA